MLLLLWNIILFALKCYVLGSCLIYLSVEAVELLTVLFLHMNYLFSIGLLDYNITGIFSLNLRVTIRVLIVLILGFFIFIINIALSLIWRLSMFLLIFIRLNTGAARIIIIIRVLNLWDLLFLLIRVHNLTLCFYLR